MALSTWFQPAIIKTSIQRQCCTPSRIGIRSLTHLFPKNQAQADSRLIPLKIQPKQGWDCRCAQKISRTALGLTGFSRHQNEAIVSMYEQMGWKQDPAYVFAASQSSDSNLDELLENFRKEDRDAGGFNFAKGVHLLNKGQHKESLYYLANAYHSEEMQPLSVYYSMIASLKGDLGSVVVNQAKHYLENSAKEPLVDLPYEELRARIFLSAAFGVEIDVDATIAAVEEVATSEEQFYELIDAVKYAICKGVSPEHALHIYESLLKAWCIKDSD